MICQDNGLIRDVWAEISVNGGCSGGLRNVLIGIFDVNGGVRTFFGGVALSDWWISNGGFRACVGCMWFVNGGCLL